MYIFEILLGYNTKFCVNVCLGKLFLFALLNF